MKPNVTLLKRLAIVSFFLVLSPIYRTFAIDSVNYSTIPPESLDTRKIPQLVCLGFDDNKFYGGLKWARDMLSSKTNPAGVGNKGTFDGTSVLASFYLISHEFYLEEIDPWVFDTIVFMLGDSLLEIRKELYDLGHEIGNHTKTHNIASAVMNKDDWLYEVLTCSKYIVNNMGVPPMDIYGFRTPYLDYSVPNTFNVLKELGLLYDCTLEDGSFGSTHDSSHIFPHTLNNGHLFLPTLRVRGLWETPHCIFITGSSTYDLKGFDSNLWPVSTQGVSGSRFLDILKRSLDTRYDGNRAPMDIGLHTDYYAEENTGVQFNSSCEERRNALEAFVDYALSLPDVRIVPMIKFIEWMRHPVTLDNTELNDILTLDTSNASGNLVHTAVTIETDVDNIGSSISTNIENNILKADATLNATMSNGNINGYIDITIQFAKSMEDVKAMKIEYKSDLPLKISLPQEPLSESRNSYKKELPSSSDWNTEYLIVNSYFFKKPRACPDNLDDVELDLTKVTSMTFSPVLLDTIMQGTIEFKEVKCFGAGEIGNTSVKNNALYLQRQDVVIKRINNHNIQITVPYTGKYSLDLFDLKGRKITSIFNKQLTQGTHTIPWDINICGSAVYMLKLKGMGNQKIKRFFKM